VTGAAGVAAVVVAATLLGAGGESPREAPAAAPAEASGVDDGTAVAGVVDGDGPRASGPPDRGSTTVRARRRRPGASEIVVDHHEADRAPGTRRDPLQVVLALPTVARAPMSSGQLVVGGAAPRDTRVLVDGVELPRLMHLGGWRSLVGADLVDDVTLVPAAFGVERGRALGGVVEVRTRRTVPDGLTGGVALDPLDGEATLRFGEGDDGLRVDSAVTGHVGLAALWATPLIAIPGGADALSLVPLPLTWDVTGRAGLTFVDAGGDPMDVSVGVIAAGDDLAQDDGAFDPAVRRIRDVSLSTGRVWLEHGRALADGRLLVTGSLGHDHGSDRVRAGGTSAALDVDSLQFALRTLWRGPTHVIAPPVTLRPLLGIDVQRTTSTLHRTGSPGLPAREGDVVVFLQTPVDEDTGDLWDTDVVNVAPFMAVDGNAGRVSAQVGLRLDAFVLSTSRLLPRLGDAPDIGHTGFHLAPAPRASLALRASDDVVLRVAAGLFYQAPDPSDASAVFGAPVLGPEEAAHVAVAADVALWPAWRLETTLFARALDHLVVRADTPSPPLAGALVQEGRGTVQGATLLLRRALVDGTAGWVSWTLSRSERQDHPGEPPRLFDFDQTHVLQAVLTHAIGDVVVGGRARAATGNPRTPVVGAVFDALHDRFDPVFGPHNAERLPAFFALDARVDWTLHLDTVDVTLSADVENLTSQTNGEEFLWRFDYGERALLGGLPLLAVVGARASW